jgi:hypothetical protein
MQYGTFRRPRQPEAPVGRAQAGRSLAEKALADKAMASKKQVAKGQARLRAKPMDEGKGRTATIGPVAVAAEDKGEAAGEAKTKLPVESKPKSTERIH